MPKYLLSESRDPFETKDVAYYYDLAAGLAREGNEVTLFLVQNGVLPARAHARAEGLAEAAQAGVKALADEFSLRERGIGAGAVAKGVKAAPIDTIIDALAEGAKALWH